MTLITPFKEPTVPPRTVWWGQDCHGEEGFPKDKESTEELAMAVGGPFSQEREWTALRPLGRYVRGAISRNLREAGIARAQDSRQSKGKEARRQAGPTQGVFLPRGRISTFLWARRTQKCSGQRWCQKT